MPYSGEVRIAKRADGTEGPVFVGTAVVYEKWSTDIPWFKEKIAVGAGEDAVRECDVVANFNHSFDALLGRTTSEKVGPEGERSLVLTDDKVGVHVVNYPPDTQLAHDMEQWMRRGEVKHMSFQFRVPPGGDVWQGTIDEPERIIKRFYPLIDVSYVVRAAYAQTFAAARDAMASAGFAPDDVRTVFAKSKLGFELSQPEARMRMELSRWIRGAFLQGDALGHVAFALDGGEPSGADGERPGTSEADLVRAHEVRQLRLWAEYLRDAFAGHAMK
jgi:hypothetical protein